MDAFDQLNLVAEISAALLGFIAVFLALSRADGRFAESDRHFIQALVLSAALSIVFAITPRSLTLFVADSSAWYAATILAIILGSLAMFLQARLQLRMSHEEAVQIHWLWHVLAWMLGIGSAMLFLLALLDSSRMIAYYVSGVSLLVPLSLWVFVGLVFRRFF